MPAIGIDLGTTYSCVAYLKDGIVRFVGDTGRQLIPSCVAFAGDQILVGVNAMQQIQLNPRSTTYHFKRMLGCQFDDKAVQTRRKLWSYEVVSDNGKPKLLVETSHSKMVWSAEYLAGVLLQHLKKLAENHIREQITQAVITVPATFSMAQRSVVKEAAENAGLEVIGLINEPTAAIVACSPELEEGNKFLLVFDFGGGTCDVTIGQYENNELNVLASTGDANLGGEDFDQALVDYCCEKFNAKYNCNLNNEKEALLRLREECERAKRRLSDEYQTEIEVPYIKNELHLKQTITRDQFERLNEVNFAKAMQLVERCLKEAGVTKEQIYFVLLVGGSTRTPRIEAMLADYFGDMKLNRSMHPDLSVAHGAALLAAYLSGQTDEIDKHIKKFYDVTPLSFGIETYDGKMCVVFPRNTPLPDSKTLRFSAKSFNRLYIRLYEGEMDYVKDNFYVGEACVDIYPPYRETVEVNFRLDRNSNISLYLVTEENNGIIDLPIYDAQYRLCQQDIDYMIQNVEENCETVQARVKRNRLKDDVHHYATRLTYLCSRAKRIPDKIKKSILKRCKIACHRIERCATESSEFYQAILTELKKLENELHQRGHIMS